MGKRLCPYDPECLVLQTIRAFANSDASFENSLGKQFCDCSEKIMEKCPSYQHYQTIERNFLRLLDSEELALAREGMISIGEARGNGMRCLTNRP